MTGRRGVVYLVGAGPGDPRLITVRGLECLRRADVVVYDRLVNPALLAEAPAAKHVFAGQSSGGHGARQEEINRLLVDHARAGRTIVRLKGGDAFVFGRGGEEALACAAAGIECEMVPGVSSAIAVPARAGIPVTHRGVSGGFAVVTGHCMERDRLDWAALARLDTVVVLMGLERLSEIASLLQRHGRSPQTPAAVIAQGTLPEEQVVVATLGEIASAASRAGLRPPATIVVGEVVRLRERLAAASPAIQDELLAIAAV